jgi:hypothetical protein
MESNRPTALAALRFFRTFDGVLTILLVLFLGTTVMYARHSGLLPTKEKLLVGENLVGKLSKVVDPSIPVLVPIGYDSQFFWALSQDPFMANPLVTASLDSPSYRYQRVLFPFLTWLTPGGVENLTIRLWLVNLVGWLLGLVAVLLIARHQKIPAFLLVLAYVLNGGIWFSWLHPMAEVWATALCLWGLYLCLTQKLGLAAVLWAFAALAREVCILLPLSVGLYHVLKGRVFVKENLWMGLALVPALVWQVAIFAALHVWSFQQSYNNFDFPLLGIFKGALAIIARHDWKTLLACGLSTAFLVGMIVRIGLPKTLLDFVLVVQLVFLLFAGVAIMESIESIIRVVVFATLVSAIFLANRFVEFQKRESGKPATVSP